MASQRIRLLVASLGTSNGLLVVPILLATTVGDANCYVAVVPTKRMAVVIRLLKGLRCRSFFLDALERLHQVLCAIQPEAFSLEIWYSHLSMHTGLSHHCCVGPE